MVITSPESILSSLPLQIDIQLASKPHTRWQPGIRVSCRFAGRVCVLPPTRPDSTSQVDTRPMPLVLRMHSRHVPSVRYSLVRRCHITSRQPLSHPAHAHAGPTGWLAAGKDAGDIKAPSAEASAGHSFPLSYMLDAAKVQFKSRYHSLITSFLSTSRHSFFFPSFFSKNRIGCYVCVAPPLAGRLVSPPPRASALEPTSDLCALSLSFLFLLHIQSRFHAWRVDIFGAWRIF
ncbi:hypothetical protein V8C44DRAFT_344293 [Trichoderma aethiopicum]